MSDQALPLDQLLADHMPALTVFLRHKVGGELAGREEIADLAQSVCREVLQDRDRLQFATAEAFRTFLFLQAAHKVIDRARFHRMARRDSRRERPLPDESRSAAEIGLYSQLASATQAALAREQLAEFEKHLDQLPEAQREVLLLSRVAGLSYAAIAAQRGVAESTVRGLAARGLARLCVQLERPEA